MTDRTEHDAIQDTTAGAISRLAFKPGDAGNFATLPEGWKVESLEQFQERPNRIKAAHTFVSTVSLAAYLNRFATAATMVTVDYKAARISAVIDGDEPGLPAFKAHQAAYVAQIDERLAEWLKLGPMTQAQFGEFLEDRALDVKHPDPATVYEMVMTFEATKKVDFKSAQRLRDGSFQILYVEDTEQRGALTMPDHFTLLLPVYRGMEPQPLKFMVRHRINEGALRFTVKMHDEEQVKRAAFERCVDALKTELKVELPLFVVG
jgi:uncharacterized protein YfdQ (DUF2303 family)